VMCSKRLPLVIKFNTELF